MEVDPNDVGRRVSTRPARPRRDVGCPSVEGSGHDKSNACRDTGRVRDPVAPEAEFRKEAIAALAAGDWYASYQWAKGWIRGGGGAWIVDPWLVYVASALLHGQPRTAVHSTDLALKHWIPEAEDRAILLWIRGEIVRRRLNDPKAALANLASAAESAPSWLAEQAAADHQACEIEASASRKRKPSVGSAPDYEGPGTAVHTVARRSPHPVGERPAVWDAVIARLR